MDGQTMRFLEYDLLIQDLFHLLDANGADTASQEELVKAGGSFFFSPFVVEHTFLLVRINLLNPKSRFHMYV